MHPISLKISQSQGERQHRIYTALYLYILSSKTDLLPSVYPADVIVHYNFVNFEFAVTLSQRRGSKMRLELKLASVNLQLDFGFAYARDLTCLH